MEKTTILIGNGFNFFVSNYVNNERYKDMILAKLKNAMRDLNETQLLEVMWNLQSITKEYCGLLDGITLSNYHDEKGEYLLQQLSDFCEKIDDQSGVRFIEEAICQKIKKDMYESAKDASVASIPITIRTIFKYNTSYFSSKLLKTLEAFGFAEVDIVTTNYDGIVSEVFQKHYQGEEHRAIHYTAIHGEYKDKQIICSAPILKEAKVEGDLMDALETMLSNSKLIILFGIGLRSDPHILKRLNDVRGKSFVIIDACRNDYLTKNYRITTPEELGFDFLFHNSIYFINTGKPTVENDQLIRPIETPEELLNKLDDLLRFHKIL